MDDSTLTALKGSIAKWEAIVAGTDIDRGPDNCSLCWMFWKNDCIGCPVAESTGETCCEGTPYAHEWYRLAAKVPCAGAPWRQSSSVLGKDGQPIPAAVRAAQAELDFLRGLLPMEEGR